MKQNSFFSILWRGFRGQCPKCGVGKIFKNWFVLNSKCSSCGCLFQQREDDTYFFMYISTGFLTGLFIIGMFFVMPRDFRYGKLILLFLSLGLFVLTHPLRKGLAIAIDCYVDGKSEFPKHQERFKN